MKTITVHEADAASPFRYPDPNANGATEPHPLAGQDDPANPGQKFPATRPKTLGYLFGRVTGDENAKDKQLSAEMEANIRAVSAFLEGAALDDADAAIAAKSADLAARRAAFDAANKPTP